MAKIKPIKNLIVNDIPITTNTNWKNLYNTDKAAWFAYTLFMNSAYPAYLKNEVFLRYGVQKISITPSDHIKYQKERNEHPEWF